MMMTMMMMLMLIRRRGSFSGVSLTGVKKSKMSPTLRTGRLFELDRD